jgi:hypothetical protein
MPFTILLVVEGKCIIATGREQIAPSNFDRLLVPHGLEKLEIVADETVVFLERQPPLLFDEY